MAEENEEGEEQTAEENEGGGKKKLIIIGAIAAVLLLGGGGAAFFFMGSSGGSAEADADGSSSEAAGDASGDSQDGDSAGSEGENKDGEGSSNAAAASSSSDSSDENKINFGETFPLKAFHINLGNPLENRYIRLEISLEFRSGATQKKELEARTPQIRDAVISVVSRKTREFLLGPDGKDQLRLEILNRINQYMDRKIEAVYIMDMLVE